MNIAQIHLLNFFFYHLQTVGLGKLRPNILMLGYKSNWHEHLKDPQDLLDYLNIIQ